MARFIRRAFYDRVTTASAFTPNDLRLPRGSQVISIHPNARDRDGYKNHCGDHDHDPTARDGLTGRLHLLFQTAPPYGELTAAEVPFELVSVTPTLVIAVALPVTVKGTVNLN